MSQRVADFLRRHLGGFAALGIVALAPKCLACLVAYFGVAAAALGGPELCGGSAPSSWTSVWFFVLGPAALLAWRSRFLGVR
jgi:hypothetical protein